MTASWVEEGVSTRTRFGHPTRTDREFLALRAGRALRLRIDPGHPAKPTAHATFGATPAPPIQTYCRSHGVSRAACGCEDHL